MTRKTTLSMTADQFEELDDFCEVNEIEKSRLMRKALASFVSERSPQFERSDELVDAFEEL